MPSKLRLRFIFRPLVKLIAKGLSKIGVTPNMATVIMFCLSLVSFFFLVFIQNLLLFSIFVFITGIMDGCDGAIARLTDKSTKFGGFFDSIMDRFSEFVIFLSLLVYLWDEELWNFIDMKVVVFLAFWFSIMISYLRARASNILDGDFDIGLMARSERLFFLVISSLLAYYFGFFNVFLILFMWLVMGTLIFRFMKIDKQIKEKEV